ncbi:glycosyltransferase [Vibrio vulnificus]|uniref:glycosyltransferase n=1 Tax=Vibrio vulnificus TaxID=672 RepID=UPI0009B5F247|nr:glycosyltransferase [Vibrio vulnificus]EID4391644.1 glycosyltransferase [Vibrio vulnificus]ELM6648969.1 glycosyltransferase [Vibrio vulnificus]OQK59723.1 hypothetical protein XM77_c10295 [Vibrio vulnificus]
MKITYLTWGETPRSYGVFSSQVLGQFSHTVACMKTKLDSDAINCEFVAGIPLIHSGMVREKFAYPEEINKVTSKLADSDIKFKRLNILSSQNFINSNRHSFRTFHGVSHSSLSKHFANSRPDIVHCRSYHAAYAALKVRENLGAHYKIIFDARGFWPKEVSLKKGWGMDSDNFHFLSKIEAYCLDNSDVVVSVSDTMTDVFKSKTVTPVETIYLSADIERFTSIPRAESLHSRNNALTFCYLGALSQGTWHRPKELSELFERLKHLYPNSKQMIITTSEQSEYISYFEGNSDVLLRSAKNVNELVTLLAECDIGVMSYFTPDSELEKVLANSVFAVKTSEYLAAGMPMIVNKYCGGAVSFLLNHEAGVSYDPSNLESLTLEAVEGLTKLKIGTLRETAAEYLDYEANAKRYAAIYERLLQR